LDRTQVELLRGYLEKARAKLRVARDLAQRGEWDDAVSRAYYAAFHAAQAALLTEGQRGETHQGVLTLFGLLLVKTGKLDRKWGRALANLKDDRETGDYEAMSWLDEESARRAVEEAEGFVEAVDVYVARLIDQTVKTDEPPGETG
jgi:hypothetical protein